MNEVMIIIAYSSLAGLPIIIGGFFSYLLQRKELKIKDEINHITIAFGGGILLSAISFALIPKAILSLNYFELISIFLAGTFVFLSIDLFTSKSKGSIAQVMSMMMDFIPESLALGASFAHNHNFGLLLAIFIGLQNLPEGFNAYTELKNKMNSKSALLLMFTLSFTGIFSALLGKYFLTGYNKLIDSVLLFAAGGILYLIFQDIAPLSKKKNDYIPATGASLGFLIGIIGVKVLG